MTPRPQLCTATAIRRPSGAQDRPVTGMFPANQSRRAPVAISTTETIVPPTSVSAKANLVPSWLRASTGSIPGTPPPGSGTSSDVPGRPFSSRRTRKNRTPDSCPRVPESRNVRLSGAAAASFQDDSIPGGSGTAAMNLPVPASCTEGGTGVTIGVLERSGNRAIGTLAETKKRGGPVPAKGAAVAIGTARDDARSGRAGIVADGPADPPHGDGVDGGGAEGGTGNGVAAAPRGRMETRSAAGESPQPPTRVSTSNPAAATAARGNTR